MLEQIKSWAHLAQIGHSRSSITNPLQWTIVILFLGISVFIIERAPTWLVDVTGCFLVLFGLLLAYAYLYFMHKQPDVLRSEHFHLSKMAIERGLVGDSSHGLVDAESLQTSGTKLLAGEPPRAESER